MTRDGHRIGLILALLFVSPAVKAAPISLDATSHHLGTPGKPEWEEFAGSPAEGRSLEVRFAGQTNRGAATLSLRQHGVKLAWGVRLNGRALGGLVTMEEPLVLTLPIPPGAVRDGENTLTIVLPSGDDDIVVSEITLDARPLAEVLGEASLDIQVRDTETRAPLACRITVVDDRGALAPLFAPPDPHRAVRAGVAYTADGQARLGVRPGRYTVYATRGFEYGVARREIILEAGRNETIALAIRREVATPGLVACDTHVHTLTHSGHGDATIEERVVTLAGEGIELPIATDHNHLTDLRPAAARAGLADAFTPVIGDEVTTRRGHFNALPFAPADRVPDSQSDDWPALIRGIRADSSDRVVILNHPRDMHGTFRPFDAAHFNSVAGAPRGSPEYRFDAVEALNSGAMQSDPLLLFRDWFALWNHGTQVTAVGSSDSHDVSRFIVGQGRTYVACRDAEANRIDIGEACRSLRAGRALVSFGLLTGLLVDERFHVGDLATGLGNPMTVTVTVLGPSWTQADRVVLYANGVIVGERALELSSVAGEKARVTWRLPRPPYDVALVAIASGPGLTAPYCPTPRPYQPTSPRWRPRVLGATNPIRVDGDGDGVFTGPRARAAALIARSGNDPESLLPALQTSDEAGAAQAADLCQAAGRDVRGGEFERRLSQAPEPVRRGFAAYAATLPAR